MVQIYGGGGVWVNFPDGWFRPPTFMERIVKPWEDVVSFSVPREVPAPETPPPEAFLQWGKASQFQNNNFRDKASFGGGGTTDDDDDENDEVLAFHETGRNTSDKRIENPEDPDQFVIVAQIDSMTLDGPGGKKYKFTFSNPG